MIKLSEHRLFGNSSDGLALVLASEATMTDLRKYSYPHQLRLASSTTPKRVSVGTMAFSVKRELGRGGNGIVMLVEAGVDVNIAVKSQEHADCLAWEYVVLGRLRERFGTEGRKGFPAPLGYVSLKDGALMGMKEASTSGMTLVDLRNAYKFEKRSVPLPLVVFYTSRMLCHIETLHWKGKVLHCDVKPDNWILVAGDVLSGSGTMVEGADLMLVDFGRAIDLVTCAEKKGVAEPLDVMIEGDNDVAVEACVAMREGRCWSFDADWFGICASVHVLLFGEHIKVEKRGKKWAPTKKFSGSDLLTAVFDVLLNPGPVCRPGNLRLLRQTIQEKYLDAHTNEIRVLLKDQRRIMLQWVRSN
mmetsp:Transcript_3551/g.4848  ORF Transcript_3551/g.4848 Transcript_3551/m.4848 type:complete len:359 (+) Transcript_3551:864-1940(+)